MSGKCSGQELKFCMPYKCKLNFNLQSTGSSLVEHTFSPNGLLQESPGYYINKGRLTGMTN